ncbi:sensor domain-containing diguanylate cyclase [Pseudomonas massiliensis]|uniref:sensor domain-containing diguanylate cyclase n=1 Tax=Pseudomonas massiliensis TaxID=522492 RepID=UPI000590EF55|nr:sensor domain-containing diguanylate cyclase [Pseudomonas massiliensis]
MLVAPLHPQENERQQALDELEVLDTPADPYMESLVRLARDLFKVEQVLISLVDRDRQWFKARVGLQACSTSRDASFCAHAILDPQKTLVVPDARQDERFADNPLVIGAPNIRFYAGHPLVAASGLPVGTLCLLSSSARRLAADEESRLRDLAQLVEGYLRLKGLSEHTRQLREAVTREQRKALLDPLTQIWNRAALAHFYPGEQAIASSAQEVIGILYIDLDHFKAVNDSHGHGVGDQVLVEAARRIASGLRPSDLLLRLGGEEFAVVARVTAVEQLRTIAERVRAGIANKPFETAAGLLQVRASLGAASGAPQTTAETLLAQADAALYQAKHGGRDRVCLHPPTASAG